MTTHVLLQQIEHLADQVSKQLPALLKAEGKVINDVQQAKLDAHLRAMARRSLTGEALPEFDLSLFEEVSE